MNHIVLIGHGKMGSALSKGWVKENSKYKISIIEKEEPSVNYKKFTNIKVYKNFNEFFIENKKIDFVVLAIKPQQLNDIKNDILKFENKSTVFISILAGKSVNWFKENISTEIKIVRAMPNTAISIRESMTCITTTHKWENYINTTKNIFNLVGETAVINEEKMTSATALCACGIAFFLRSIRAASQGGNEIDFHSSEALKMAAQTAKGAAALLLKNNSHPEDEIDKVTSPKGCTIAGLNEMEHNGFSSAFIKGIKVSSEKAKNLYE